MNSRWLHAKGLAHIIAEFVLLYYGGVHASVSCSHPTTLSLMFNDDSPLGTVNRTQLGMSISSFITSLPGFIAQAQLVCSF